MSNSVFAYNMDDAMGDDDEEVPEDFLEQVDMLCTQAYQGTTAKRPRRENDRPSDGLEEMKRKLLEQEGALKLLKDENEKLKAENRTSEKNYATLMNDRTKQVAEMRKEMGEKEKAHKKEVEELKCELKFKLHAKVAQNEQARRSMNASQMMAPSPARYAPPPERRPVLFDAGIQTELLVRKSAGVSSKAQLWRFPVAPFCSEWPWEVSRFTHFACLSPVPGSHRALEVDVVRAVRYLLGMSIHGRRFKQADSLLKLRDVLGALRVLARNKGSLRRDVAEMCVELGKNSIKTLKQQSGVEHLHLVVKVCEVSLKIFTSSHLRATKRLFDDVMDLASSLLVSKGTVWRTRILAFALLEAMVASASCHEVQCNFFQDRRLAPLLARRFLEDVAFDKQKCLMWSKRVLRLTSAGLPGHNAFIQPSISFRNCPSAYSAAKAATEFLTHNVSEVTLRDEEEEWEEDEGKVGDRSSALKPGAANVIERSIRALETATVGKNLVNCDFRMASLVSTVQRLATCVELGRGDETALATVVNYVMVDDEAVEGC